MTYRSAASSAARRLRACARARSAISGNMSSPISTMPTLPGLKQRLRATLPVWNNLQANAEIHDLTLQMPMAEATLKTLGETLGLSGFIADGAAEIGVKIDELAFKSRSCRPGPARFLRPRSFRPARHRPGPRRGRRARARRSEFGGKGELSPETQDKISRSCSPGHPKVVTRAGPAHDAAARPRLRGRSLADTGAPSGHFTFGADGLERPSPCSRRSPRPNRMCRRPCSASRSSRVGDDGPRRAPGVEGRDDQSGEVTVNGTPLPTGK